MKINPKSWHYKVYAFTFAYSPSTMDLDAMPKEPPRTFTLCAYARRIVFMTPLATITVIVKIALITVASALMLATIAAIFLGIPWMILDFAKEAKQGHPSARIALVCFAGTIGLFALAKRYRDRAESRREGENPPLDSFELGWAAIHAKWRKICPVLEVEDRK